jgi:predicted nucleic acid-binding protein
MEGVGLIYLDANIFIATFEVRSNLSAALRELLSKATKLERARFVTSEMTLAELLVLPFRQNDAEKVRLYSAMFAPNLWLDVHPVSREILMRAASFRANTTSLKLPDAVHLATAVRAGCTHMLTADRGIRSSGRPVILRPDESTLTSLIESLSQ